MIALLALTALLQDNTYDLIIRGGEIVDGSGKDGYIADVAIKGNKIAAIGPNLKGSSKYIDAKGLVVAPGFIDVHTHAENILTLPRAENFVHDGVTTVVIGNCGGSTLDVKKFFRQLNQVQPAINVATLVGHNSVRKEAMGGDYDRAPTKAELTKMEELVHKAMSDGAVGFSTGLEYVPGTYSKTDEVVDLAKIAASFGGIYTSHMRSEGTHEKEALKETFEVGKEGNLPVEVSHIKLDAKPYWGEAEERLKQVSDAREKGIQVTQDVYPYTAYSTTIGLLLPSWVFDGGKLKENLADPDKRKKIESDMVDIRKESGQPDYQWVAIASNDDRRLNGLRIPAAAKLVKGSDSLESQISLIFDLVQENRSSGVFFAMSEDDLVTFMKNPRTMIISDSTAESSKSPDLPHPRAYGSNARVLGQYVREKHVLELPDAIRRMTSLPAKTFKIKDRGLIETGKYADLVVFNPKTIEDQATYPNPRVFPVGIDYVFVNGTPVLEHAAQTKAGPGVPVRRDEP
ncbi:MAG TPA: D-aminoacylase [Fimbriimonas sp.]|nr:D-aminoacylase [Fimbriimonas sp.]